MAIDTQGAVNGGMQGASAGSAAGPWGAAIGAIGGAAIGAFSSNASSKKSYKYAKKLQQQAAALNYKYSLKSAENLPSSTRTGLESAGYNPMLAVQNSTQGANSSWTSATKADVADVSSAMSAGVANAHSVQRLMNETQVAESQSKTNEATAENQLSQAMNNLEQNKYIGEKRKAEIAQINGDTALKEAQIDNMKKQIELGWAGVSVNQEANAISAIGKEEYADRAKRYKEWGEKHPYLRNVDETITRYFNGIGANVGANKKVK